MVHPKWSGYLPILERRDGDADKGNQLFFAYFEKEGEKGEDEGPAPIFLWLQGGPGCASTFGLFYELGPFTLNEDLCLDPNPGSWTKLGGLLIIDQPLGTGLSFVTNASDIPRDEITMATHLYNALQAFFTRFWHLRDRPLIITGESYGGKYVPSLAHFILQAQQQQQQQQEKEGRGVKAMQTSLSLKHLRRLPDHLPAPVFKLGGIAVGNGLTAPRIQTQQLAQTAQWAGLVDATTAAQLQQRAEQVVSLIDSKKWVEARTVREDLRGNITEVAGIATMFDTRRTVDYDPFQLVDKYLNLLDVRDSLRADRKGTYITCNDTVTDVMAGDVMQSVAHLVPDLLQHIHVMFYQGQFDILDGPVSNSKWLEAMDWPLKEQFNQLPSSLWHTTDSCAPLNNTAGVRQVLSGGGLGKWSGHNSSTVGGWWRQAGKLTHAVVYRAGHMVPHDQPIAMKHLLGCWVLNALGA